MKDYVKHVSCVIYEGNCTCGCNYIGETIRNVDIRWSEHNTPLKESEPAKHLLVNPTHSFTWRIISRAARSINKRKILEAFYISKFKQLDHKRLILFKHGIT